MTTSKGHQVGYIRVSSVDQNTDRQLDGIPLDKKYEDKASGKDTHRPQLQACLDHLREGDTLLVHSMDRLARNLQDLLKLVEQLTQRGVTVRFIKENLTFKPDSADPYGMLMLQLLGAVAQFERSMIRERQREGIEKAKTKGKYKGRKPTLTREQALDIKQRNDNGVSKVDLAKEYKVSRETIYQALTKLKAESQLINLD